MLHLVRGVIADMDGVVWRGDVPLPGATEFFQFLHWQAVPYVFATNNSARSQAYYVEKLTELNIQARASQVITSATATAAYLRHKFPHLVKAFVVGEIGLKNTLLEQGFILIGEEGQPDFVISGIDREFNYHKLQLAVDYIRAGAIYIATNGDTTVPVSDGFIPGAGSIIAAIEAASGKPPVVIGKPASPMFEIALQRLGTAPQETLMIGDRMDTDIVGASLLGLKTALMLSGVTTETAIITDSAVQPDATYEHLAALLTDWRRYI